MVDNRDRQTLGRLGEDRAGAYLTGQGLALVARNWRTRAGELDIVARDGEWLVFVEVRTRTKPGDNLRYGPPEDSLTQRKLRRLAALAEAYVFATGWDGPWRIDVIALELRGDGEVARLEHWRDVVGGA